MGFLLWLGISLAAQTIDVYTEFRRVNAQGAIVEADKGGKPREILSPALVRNAWHSFHVVVKVPAGRDYALYLAQNPERLQMKLYRERPDASGVMELLDASKLSVKGKGGGADVYLLDVFVPADAPAGRVRLEAQIHDGYNWVIYPMEARVFAGIVPAYLPAGARLPASTESSVQVARHAFQEYACGEKPVPAPAAPGVRDLIRRNALQDASLARLVEQKFGGREALIAKLIERAGLPGINALCGSARVQSELGPEWYLKIRDLLFRESSR